MYKEKFEFVILGIELFGTYSFHSYSITRTKLQYSKKLTCNPKLLDKFSEVKILPLLSIRSVKYILH